MTILVVGDANADLTAQLPEFPHMGDDVVVGSLRWGSGGSATNTAVALAQLDVPTQLLARVGTDPAATIALRSAQAAGVDLRHMQIEPHAVTGLCYVIVSPEGERTFFSFRGANRELTVADPSVLLDAITWLHIGGHALLEGPQRTSVLVLVKEAQRQRIPISIDVCLPLLRARRLDMLALLPKLTILFANQPELQLLATGTSNGSPDPQALAELVSQLYHDGPELIVGKCGAAGCIVADRTGVRHVPGFSVSVVDTTGCGDAFAAGFLALRVEGADAERCAVYANACGALVAMHAGAAESLPNRVMIETFLTQYQRDVPMQPD